VSDSGNPPKQRKTICEPGNTSKTTSTVCGVPRRTASSPQVRNQHTHRRPFQRRSKWFSPRSAQWWWRAVTGLVGHPAVPCRVPASASRPVSRLTSLLRSARPSAVRCSSLTRRSVECGRRGAEGPTHLHQTGGRGLGGCDRSRTRTLHILHIRSIYPVNAAAAPARCRSRPLIQGPSGRRFRCAGAG
jgi:hypothetical protein